MAIATGYGLFGRGFTLIMTEDGNVFTNGDNTYGQIGISDFEVHDQPCVLKYVDTFADMKW